MTGGTVSTPVVTLSGGSMADGTYYYVITSSDGTGETIKGTEVAVVVSGGGGQAQVRVTRATSGVGWVYWKLYRSTTSGVYTTPSYIGQRYTYNVEVLSQ